MVMRLRAKGGWKYLLDHVAAGKPMELLIRELETSRWEFYLWLHKTERAWASYKLARKIAADGIFDEGKAIADGPDPELDSKERILRDKIRLEWRKYQASVDDPDTYGKREERVLHQTINVLHLDALRTRIADARELLESNRLAPGLRKTERLVKADVVDAEIIEEEDNHA
jgi:hypothetical protein